jgi:type VII secretion-associated serine protease mycosin
VSNVGGRPVISTRTVADRAAAEAAVATAQQDPRTVSVGVDHVVHATDLNATAAQTNDPYRAVQWGLTKLQAEQDWARTTGAGVTVAVVDTGVQAGHPDLAGSVLTGVDLVNAGGDGSDDENGHGTHVAGIIAAVAGNGIGGAGLAPNVKILPVRVLDADGSGYDSDIATGMTQAVDKGAKVINLSLGGSEESTALSAAIQYALGKGVVVVAAAGNERQSGNAVSYPAADAGVIGVAATDSSDKDASFSNTGSYVDVAAPGVSIISTYKGSTYKSLSGTSMATPFVAAAAALLKAAAPNLTPDAVTSVLERTATDLGTAGRDNATGYGLINPYSALCTLVTCGESTPTTEPTTQPTTTPTTAPAAPVATRLALTTSGGQYGYGSKVTVKARLVQAGNGSALSGVAADLCVKAAPAGSFRCTAATTAADGSVGITLTLQGLTSVYVSYAGSDAAAAATSATATYRVNPKLTPKGGRGVVTATVLPGGGRSVTLDRWNGKTWQAVKSAKSTGAATGKVSFTKLKAGSYRVRTAATSTLVAVASAPVRVR